MEQRFKEAYKKFLETWGVDMQSIMAIEEMSELTKAICKEKRCRGISGKHEEALVNIKEEIADVLNVAEQLAYVYGEEEIEEIRNQKIERTLNKIKEEKCRKK